jgi:hypothetical protein
VNRPNSDEILSVSIKRAERAVREEERVREEAGAKTETDAGVETEQWEEGSGDERESSHQ